MSNQMEEKECDQKIEKVLDRMHTAAKKFSREPRVYGEGANDCPIGNYIQQGDLYLKRESLRSFRKGKVGKEIGSTQTRRRLVKGTSKGARHEILPGTARVYEPTEKSPLIGPIVYAPDGFVLEHNGNVDGHATVDCHLPGVYRTHYQLDWTAKEREEERRARD